MPDLDAACCDVTGFAGEAARARTRRRNKYASGRLVPMEELQAIAKCLGDDVRTAGPRFSVAITETPDLARELQLWNALLVSHQRPNRWARLFSWPSTGTRT
jgi:hypothetical protein